MKSEDVHSPTLIPQLCCVVAVLQYDCLEFHLQHICPETNIASHVYVLNISNTLVYLNVLVDTVSSVIFMPLIRKNISA